MVQLCFHVADLLLKGTEICVLALLSFPIRKVKDEGYELPRSMPGARSACRSSNLVRHNPTYLCNHNSIDWSAAILGM